MTPLRQRILEDMQMRNFSRETQMVCVRAVMQLARRWVDEFVSETLGRSRSVSMLPDDLVASLPDSVRVFYAPN